MKRRLALLAVAAPLLLGFQGAPQAGTARVASPAVPKTVKMVNFAFQPATISIAAGTRVVWKNTTSTTNHTSTSNTGVWDSGIVPPGGRFSRMFNRTGTFRYHCSVHPTQMRGTITVT
jgi:plastocyanin